jgi:NAD+ kinase
VNTDGAVHENYDGPQGGPMRDVLLVAYRSRSDAVELAGSAAASLVRDGIAAATYFIGDDGSVKATAETLVVSLGGDGTFLRAARLAHEADAEVLGVNLGRVGFLLSLAPESLHSEIHKAIARELDVEHRVALRVKSAAEGIDEFCLNEVVLERSQIGHMVRVRTFIGGDEFLTYSADGVMVATATGSTAYNFSAGGPVVSPDLGVMVLTPIAPHFTIDRSVVVGSNRPVRLQALDSDAAIVADGSLAGHLAAGGSVEVTNDPRGVKVVVTEQLGLGARLRQSLREGHA